MPKTAVSENTHKIESGIAVPKNRRNEESWKLAEMMEIGESIFFTKEKEAKTLRNILRKMEHKAVLKPDTKDGADGWRVWKV